MLSIIFVVSFIVYYLNCWNEMAFYNSDSAYYALAGKDIMSGNIFLKGWYGSTNSFYFISLVYGIFGSIFGFTGGLVYLVSAFVWAALIVTIAFIIMSMYSQADMYEKLMRVVVPIALCFCSCYFSQDIKVIGGYHLDVAIIGILFMWIIAKEIDECKNYTVSLSVLLFFMFLSILSDQLVLAFIVLPIIVLLFISLFFVSTHGEKIGYTDVFSMEQKINGVTGDILAGEDKVVLENVKVHEGCTDAELRTYVYVPGLTIRKIVIEKQY